MKHSIKTKILCSLLSVLFVMQIMPWSAVATENESTTEISNTYDCEKENLAVVSEVIKERNQYSKTFLLEDGSFYTVTNSNPIHKFENGSWENAVETNISVSDMESAVMQIEELAEKNDSNLSNNSRIIITDNNPSDVAYRFLDNTIANMIQSSSSMWVKVLNTKTAPESKQMITTSAKIILNCQSTQSGTLKVYTVNSNWDPSIDYTVKTTTSPEKVKLEFDNAIEDFKKITTTGNYEFEITDVYTKWERGILKDNGVIITFKGSMGKAKVSGCTFTRKYRIIDEFDQNYSHHAIDMGKAGIVYINDFTNTLLLRRDEVSLGGETFPLVLSSYYDFGRKYSMLNPFGMGGRWSVESKLYELSSETYAWDNLEGETIYFSQKEVLDNNTRIWTSSDNPDVLLYENCSKSYDGNYSGNKIICKGITYNFTDDGTVCLLTDSQNNNIKIQHSVNKINGTDVVNTSYINYITDASGRCYKLTKSKKAGGKDVYTQLSVFENERSGANPIQMGDTNYTVGYEYTSHSDGLQALLTSVTYPDGSRVTYEYSNNQLVKITDVNDNILEINYLPSCDNTATNIVTGYEKYKIVNGQKYTIEKINIDNSDTYRRVFSDINGEVVTQQYNRKLDLISEMDNEGNAYFISYDAYGKIVRWVVPEETNNILINGNFESELSDEGIIDGWAYLSNEDNAYLENVDNSSCLVVNDNSQGREGVGQDIETVTFGTQLFTVGCTVQGTSLVPSEGTFVGIEIFAFDADGNYLKYDGEIAEDEEPYFSLEIDNTTNSKQYIMDAFVLREEVVQISVCLSSINQIADVKFDDVVLYPSSIIINNSENNTSTCGCGTACTMGEGCACECENSQNCNCVSCRTYKKDEYVYNDITGKLEYVEHKNTDGIKTMNSVSYYDDNGNYLAKEIDENGNETLYNHDIYTGLLNSKTTGSGTVTYGYNSAGLLTEVTQIITPITSTTEDNSIEMTNVYSYDNDKIESITHNGFTYNFTYDALGNCNAVKVGDSTLVSYNKDDAQNEIVYADGYRIRYSYSNGCVEKIYENDSTEPIYEYIYDNGNLKKIIDNVNGLTTEYNCNTTVGYKEYQKAGVFDIIVYRNGNTRDVRYAKLHTDDGVYEYFAEEDYVVHDTITKYDNNTGITMRSTCTDISNNRTIITASTTDVFGRRINPDTSMAINENSWNETTSTANTILQKDALDLVTAKSETSYYYSDTETQAFSEVTGYSNKVSKITNSSYRDLDYLYNLNEKWDDGYNLISDNEGAIITVYTDSDSDTIVARYEYNSNGQIIKEEYGFNELNNPVYFYVYTYDENGKVNSVTNRGYQYDSDNVTVTNEYNYGMSNILFNETNQSYYSYYVSTWSNQYSYEYDECGNITKIFNGLEASSENLIAQYHYDEAQQLVREDDSRLNKTYTYTYDVGGNLTSKNEYAYTTEGLGTIVDSKPYVYDDSWNDKLVSFDGKDLDYDAENNRYIYGDPANTDGEEYRYYEWQGNQLISCSIFNRDNITTSNEKIVYTYNNDGLRSSKTVYHYAADSNGTLLKNDDDEYYIAADETGTRTEYFWKNGRLVYSWLGPDPIAETRDDDLAGDVREQNASLTIKYLYDENGEPYGMITNEHNVFYFVKNMHGDVEKVISAAEGVRMISYKYDAWGNMTYTLNLSTIETALASLIVLGNNAITYRGYNYDYETSLYYLQSRYYSPEWGRFLSADDFENIIASPKDILSVNAFAYCFNNPVMYTDTTGEWPNQYPVPKWTRAGFDIYPYKSFTNKKYCTNYSDAVIKEKGQFGYFKTMNNQRIASELFAHAELFYASDKIKKSSLYKNKTIKKVVDYVYLHSEMISVNNDEPLYRVICYDLLWNSSI